MIEVTEGGSMRSALRFSWLSLYQPLLFLEVVQSWQGLRRSMTTYLFYVVWKNPRSQRWLAVQTLRFYRRQLRQAFFYGMSLQDLDLMLLSGCCFKIPCDNSSRLTRVRRRMDWLKSFLSAHSELQDCVQPGIGNILKSYKQNEFGDWSPVIYSGKPFLHPRLPETGWDFELNFYIIPSPLGVDWSEPRRLCRALLNYLIPGKWHRIGHVGVELRQRDRTIAATGMTGDTNSEVLKNLVFRRMGFGVLLTTFRGRLEKSDEFLQDLAMHIRRRQVRYIRFKLDQSRFDEAFQFVRTWSESGQFQRYGLMHDPLKGEGAGCAAFGVSLLRHIDVVSPQLLGRWQQVLRADRHWFGDGSKAQGLSFARWIIRLLGSKRWIYKTGEKIELRFYEPDLIFSWVTKAYESESYCNESFGRAKGLLVDATRRHLFDSLSKK